MASTTLGFILKALQEKAFTGNTASLAGGQSGRLSLLQKLNTLRGKASSPGLGSFD